MQQNEIRIDIQTEMNSLLVLSNELLIHIANFLPFKDRFKLGMVNKRLCTIAYDECSLKSLAYRSHREQFFLNLKQMKITNIKNAQNKIQLLKEDRIPVKALSILFCISTLLWIGFLGSLLKNKEDKTTNMSEVFDLFVYGLVGMVFTLNTLVGSISRIKNYVKIHKIQKEIQELEKRDFPRIRFR